MAATGTSPLAAFAFNELDQPTERRLETEMLRGLKPDFAC
jgi:hypothetical protein